ncbi:hypothetical protein [Nostoc sp.]|uniref:hypothetical protein n=1 Tax=Nostoc sp. TaxID=1180 RepID=UPI002FF6AD95
MGEKETSRRFLPDTARSLLPRSGRGLALSVRVTSRKEAMPLAFALASLKEKPLVRVSVFVHAASPTGEGEEKALRCASVKEENCARCLTTFTIRA